MAWKPIETLPKNGQALVTDDDPGEVGSGYATIELITCPTFDNDTRAGVWKWWHPVPAKDFEPAIRKSQQQSIEPDLIVINKSGLQGGQARDWFSDQATKAAKKGMRHARASVHPKRGWLLYEAWMDAPMCDGQLAEGGPRWSQVE